MTQSHLMFKSNNYTAVISKSILYILYNFYQILVFFLLTSESMVCEEKSTL